jgi:hypothetical protein
MYFQVVPDTHEIAPIPTDTVKEAISISLKLFIKLGFRSAIRDCDGNTLTEKEVASYLYAFIG